MPGLEPVAGRASARTSQIPLEVSFV